MVFTWIGDVGPLLEDACYQRYYQQLPDFRKEKAGKYRSAEARALSAGAWILWQRAREQHHLPKQGPFNLSHSGRYVLCSAQIEGDGQVQVGCDVQQMQIYREGVARRFFCPGEYGHIQSLDGEKDRTELFYRYWVLKESFMKAVREGMALGLDSFEFHMREGACPVLKTCPGHYRKEAYFFQEFDLQSYRAAVCSSDPDIDSRLQWVEF